MVEPDRTHDNILWRMFFACWITKATHTNSQYQILLSGGTTGYANAPDYYVISTLSVFFSVQANSRVY